MIGENWGEPNNWKIANFSSSKVSKIITNMCLIKKKHFISGNYKNFSLKNNLSMKREKWEQTIFCEQIAGYRLNSPGFPKCCSLCIVWWSCKAILAKVTLVSDDKIIFIALALPPNT